jgi:membrane protease YdiL (CAAX protease family)
MRKWDVLDIISFELTVCGGSWLLLLLGLFAPQGFLNFTPADLSLGFVTILVTAASIMPGVLLFVFFKEARVPILRVKAGVHVYALAMLLGLVLPLFSQFGCGERAQLWNPAMPRTIVRVFLLNIWLAPLWEEIAWRGYFYPKIAPLVPRWAAMVVAALGWMIWHLGFLSFLYKSGLPLRVLLFLPVQYFCIGIILCSVFVIGKGALMPCVFLHAAFNASVVAYFGTNDRASNIGCYFAETVTVLVVSLALFVIANKRVFPLTASQGR